jgi:hypothetical protein
VLRSHIHRALMVACALAVSIAAAPAAAAAATPTTQTASSSGVTATFSFTVTSQNTYPTKTLTISRAGQVVYDQPVTSSYCGQGAVAQTYCAPGAPEPGYSSVHVLDLEHDGQPDVVLDLYTGGAHCCSVEQIFALDPGTGTYMVSQHDFGDPGERIVDLGHNGRYEFLTADDTFAYAFTAFAASGLPIKILTFAGGRFTDVTRQYPKLIAKDAAQYLKDFKRNLSDGVGLIAAWAADEDNLGHTGLVSSTLNKELKAGNLRAVDAPAGKRFIKALNKLLKKDGYVH